MSQPTGSRATGSQPTGSRATGQVTDHFVSFDGTELYYDQEGTGPPVILLHGFTSSVDGNWRQPGIWRAVLDAGRQALGFDARGHGRSEKPHDPAAYENDAMVRDVAAFFDHVGLGEADLVGYSMGAATAIRFAASDVVAGDQRLRRLVLGGIGGDPARWAAPETVEARAKMGRRMLAAAEAPDAGAIDDRLTRRIRRVMDARGNDLQAMAAIQRARRPLGGDFAPAKVSVPTLVVCGDKDTSPHDLAAALPRARSLVLEGDHEGVVINPALAKAITAFLSDS
jgi:pimeloyl-ACP methyl ester carboxylesterase